MKKTLAVAARVFSMSPLYNNQLMDTVYPTYTRMILGRPNHTKKINLGWRGSWFNSFYKVLLTYHYFRKKKSKKKYKYFFNYIFNLNFLSIISKNKKKTSFFIFMFETLKFFIWSKYKDFFESWVLISHFKFYLKIKMFLYFYIFRLFFVWESTNEINKKY